MSFWSYLLAAPFAVASISWLVKRIFPWISEDIAYLKAFVSLLSRFGKFEASNLILYDMLQKRAGEQGDQRFILFKDEVWTYKQMLWWSNKCCRALRSEGLEPRDKIAMFMMNEPAFLATWLGSMALGVVPAFINTNLRTKSLLHCIDIAEVKLLIVGKDPSLLEAVNQIKEDLQERNIAVYVYGERTDNCWSFSQLVDKQKNEDIPHDWRGERAFSDPACYIYTSGTTGLPKAVKVSSQKCFQGGVMVSLLNPTSSDIVYTPLPLYHTSAALLGFCGTLIAGCTMVLRKKFSASNLWPDCRKYDVTIIQYIGETMRYVCKQPTTPDDRKHKVRAILGNGLRPDVWRTFLDRYGENIQVMEFYAATEGNVAFINYHNKFGCIGTMSPLMKKLGNGAIVKYDFENEEFVRDANGRAIVADTNEPGLLVGKIDKTFAISSYTGKKSLTEKKILRDVFKKGDSYFNTGDILVCDEHYHLHFRDRVGDTFRWKGENVSTNEVSDIVVQGPGIKEANVYGVEVPGSEGRIGMTAVVLEEDELHCKAFYDYVCDSLPSYARPCFVRVTDCLELTGTLKQRKVALRKEGFNLKVVDDKIYFLDNDKKLYVPFTAEMQDEIEVGTIRM
uniref:Very long-chain fatty acid transport protein n=1 Tax=Phallusia mammillata TaxID=59560 RepID=A0A6F9DRW8_9ASCI|nr:very long-chain acyl-CoA synthetase-like [Phallusia mammillata]